MITARRVSTTERRGVEHQKRRPTAILVAVTALSLAPLTGCASKTTDTYADGRPYPGNQDTAAAQAVIRAAGGTHKQALPAASVAPSSPPSTDGTWGTVQAAETDISAKLLATVPTFAVTPQQNPQAGIKPVLEIITMPMWLWTNTPSFQATAGAQTVIGQIVVDNVKWNFMNGTSAMGAPLACGGTTPAVHNLGAGMPYTPNASAADPYNTASAPAPCVTSFTAPFYAYDTNSTPTADATISVQGAAMWHVEFSVDGAAFGPVLGIGDVSVAAPVAPLANPNIVYFRVGEIQALAVGS